MLVVKLPNRLRVDSMYSLLSQIIDERQQPRSPQMVFDFSKLMFVDPNGLTVLSNTLEWLKKRAIRPAMTNLSPGEQAIIYLDDCGFFREYEGKPVRLLAAPRNTMIPLRKLLVQESHAWLDHRVVPWLAARLGVTASSLAEVKTCIREIFNNIDNHSTEQIGCIHIQWFPNDHRIRISISDFGIGIPTEISRAFTVASDAEAINLASQVGVTSKRGGRNQGAGLPYLIDIVVRNNGGFVGIYSNRGQLTCSLGKHGIQRNVRAAAGFYPGTLISIDLRTDRIENRPDEREDLEW